MKEYSKNELNKVVRGSKRANYDVSMINQVLDDAFLCNVGYVWKGKAIVIPTAYGRQDDKVFIHGSLKNRMLLSLIDAGEACLSVTHLDGLVLARSAFHHSANYRSVNIFGKVSKVEDPDLKMEALACILNHMIPGHWNNVRHPNPKEFNATLVLEIKIDSASAKIRAEGVNDEPDDQQLPIWAGVIPIKQVTFDAESDNDRVVPKEVIDYIEKNR